MPARLLLIPRTACLWLAVANASADELPRAFEPVPDNPVFAPSSSGWDTSIRERGWILREGGLWRLWYTGYVAGSNPPLMKLGHATSPDGIHWSRAGREPLAGDAWVEDVMVVPHGGTYFMFAEGAGDRAQLLSSSDGLAWRRLGTLDVRLSTGEPIPPGPFGTPVGHFEDGTWHLFYERQDRGVWLATSADMRVWTNVTDEPVIPRDRGGVDEAMIAMNQLLKVGDEYVAVLHGSQDAVAPRTWCTYLARSRDLRHWTKEPPLRPVAENKSSGQVVFDGQRWRLYTMHGHVDLHLPPAAE